MLDSYWLTIGHMEVRPIRKNKAAVMSILLYGCTTWMLTKQMKRKLVSNCTKMLQAVLNKSWRQNPTKQRLYGHLSPISRTLQIRWVRHAGHCWRSKGKLISNVPLWTSSYRWARVGQPVRTYLQQLSTDTRCSVEDLLGVMDDRDERQEGVRKICASSTPWWWWLLV